MTNSADVMKYLDAHPEAEGDFVDIVTARYRHLGSPYASTLRTVCEDPLTLVEIWNDYNHTQTLVGQDNVSFDDYVDMIGLGDRKAGWRRVNPSKLAAQALPHIDNDATFSDFAYARRYVRHPLDLAAAKAQIERYGTDIMLFEPFDPQELLTRAFINGIRDKMQREGNERLRQDLGL